MSSTAGRGPELGQVEQRLIASGISVVGSRLLARAVTGVRHVERLVLVGGEAEVGETSLVNALAVPPADGAGLRLHRVTWNSYALSPNLAVLSGEERRQLHRLHAGRTGLAESVAFILLGVVTGYRSQDWLFRLPPEDRNGIELDSLFLQADE